MMEIFVLDHAQLNAKIPKFIALDRYYQMVVRWPMFATQKQKILRERTVPVLQLRTIALLVVWNTKLYAQGTQTHLDVNHPTNVKTRQRMRWENFAQRHLFATYLAK